MKILLCEDVERLGWLGDIVEVNDGYARNYLLPQGLAGHATEANIKALAEEKSRRSQQRKLVHKKAQAVADAVNGAETTITAKANEQGHLFGSVTQQDIATKLREQGFEIADDMVRLAEHIKQVGTHEVTLKIAAELTANISVTVISQDETNESVDKDSEQ